MNDQFQEQMQSGRSRLMRLSSEFFKDDIDSVVRAIESVSGQHISVRSVQAWLIDPRRASHRKVPEWAIRALEEYVANPENQQEFQQLAERFDRRLKEPRSDLDWVDDVRQKHAVAFATSEIEAKSRHLAKWQEKLGVVAGEAIHEELWNSERELRSMSKGLAAIARALRESKTYEEFAANANNSMRSDDLTSLLVRETKTILEQKTGEFSNDEGLPVPSGK
jgi:hypothetical protein